MARKVIIRIKGHDAELLELAMDKGEDIKFEKDEESGDIMLLIEQNQA